MRYLYLIVASVFLFGCTGFTSVPSTCVVSYGSWDIIGLGALIMLLVSGIVYMGTQFFRRQDWAFVGGQIANTPGWENWVKKQIYQVFISLFIAACAAGFASFSCGLSTVFTSTDPFIAADAYLTKILWQASIPGTVQLLSFITVANSFSSIYYMIGGGTSWGFQWPLVTLTPLGNSLDLIFDMMIPLITSLVTQQVGLQIIQSTAYTVVLPVGVLLRVFAPTRDAGSFLIAVAIGFYVVFPLMYVMNGIVMDQVQQKEGDQWVLDAAKPTNIPQSVLPQILYGTINFFTLQWFKVLKVLVFTIPQAIFLPALNIVVTLSFIKSMAKSLSREFGD